jgi:hypothetical protein
MPGDPRKRQKKLERRAARRKEKKHSVARTQSAGLPGQLSAASKYPVLNCWISEQQGMGTLHLSREFPNGQVAVASFLVDRYCLGIKDAWAEVLPRPAYEEKYLRMRTGLPKRLLDPAEARKYLEEAADYAQSIGLSPHSDYRKALLLFGDIDPAASDATFEFGKDGKPLFIAGPYDSAERCRQIVAILTKHCGPDGFHYVISSERFDYAGHEPDGYLEDEDEERPW